MSVGAVGGGALETARMRLETMVALQKRVQDIAKSQMSALLGTIAPPPAHLGGRIDFQA